MSQSVSCSTWATASEAIQGEQHQRAGGEWRAGERVSGQEADEQICLSGVVRDVAVCDVTGSLEGVLDRALSYC